MQSNAKWFFILSYNYTTYVKLCAVGPPICQTACEWKRPEADFDRGLTSLVQPGLSMLNIGLKINNSDNLLACHWWAWSLEMSLLTTSSAMKTKNDKTDISLPLSLCYLLLVIAASCIWHRRWLTSFNLWSAPLSENSHTLDSRSQGPWHRIWERSRGWQGKSQIRKKSQTEFDSRWANLSLPKPWVTCKF